MISYDYTLTRDLFSEKEIHHPHSELQGPLKNIIVVEGPNGKGKSLLMNILAMSAFGYENRDVPASLKDDMSEYLRGETTKLSFNLRIEDPISEKIITAKHDDSDGINVQVFESTDGGKKGLKDDPEKLTQFVKQIYKVLMTRGMKGCFVYVRNPELRDYLKSRYHPKE